MAHQPPHRDSPTGGRRAGGIAQRVARLWGGGDGEAVSPWMPKDARYPRLRGLDVSAMGLARQSGLYACWHLGVRPQWVRVGAAMDLGAAIMHLQQHKEIVGYDANGGLFVAWAFLPAAELPGAVAYLAAQLNPVLQTLIVVGEIAAAATGTTFVFPPGTHLAVPPADKSQP